MSGADERYAGALDWGDATEMSAFETMMWRAEADPLLTSTIMSIAVMDTTPDVARFVGAHDWATRMVPRFRKKVVEPPLGLGTPLWAVDEDFDITYHVTRTALPEGVGFEGVLAAAEHMAMTPFDRNRPPWEALLVEGLPGGRAAYLIKMHHSTTDGLGAMQLFSALMRRGRDGDPDRPEPEVPHDAVPITPFRALTRQVDADVRGALGAVGGLGSLVGGVLRNPVGQVRDAAAYAMSLSRVLADPDAPGSPLLARRSTSWRLLALDVPFRPLRAASKAHGFSVNDAYVAALLGAYRRYHEAMGQPVPAIPMAIPVSVRKEGSGGGNQIATIRMSGPVATADPVERMTMISEIVRRGRSEPAADNIDVMASVLARLPGSVMAAVAGNVTKGNDLQASNVPGLGEDVYLAGARMDRWYPYAPRPGAAAMISLLTHGDTCCVGANIDPASFTEPELFRQCLVEGFEEVLALAPGEPEHPTLPS